MNIKIKALAVPVFVALSLIFGACAERATESPDGVDGTLQDGVEGVEEGAEDAGGAIEDAGDDAGNAIEDAGDDVEDASE